MGTPRRLDEHRRRLSITVSINWQRCRKPLRPRRAEPGTRRFTLMLCAMTVLCAVLANAMWPALSAPLALAMMSPPCVVACVELRRHFRPMGVRSRR